MNIRKWSKDDFKKYIEDNSECKFIDTWIKEKTNPNGKNRRYLRLMCKCGEIFECPWVEFNSKTRNRKQCNKCSKIIGYEKKSINNEHYKKLKKEKGITIKHLEDYKGRRVKITHECPICKRKDWFVTPASILNLRSKCCKPCSDKGRMYTNEYYVSKKKELGINIENIEDYKGLDVNIKHICPCCGDEWEVSPHNVDLGGCALDNPMDLIPNEITEMPAIDIDEDSLVLSTHPDLEVSHAGFISELKESGKGGGFVRYRNGNVERTWIVCEGGSSGSRDQDSVCKQIDAG